MCHICLCKLKNCCCFDIRIGSLIVLWISIVGLIFTAWIEVTAGHGWLLIVQGICFVTVILALCAVKKKNPRGLGPYLLVNVISFFFKLVCLGIFSHRGEFKSRAGDDVWFPVALTVYFGLEWYFISVVYSYYLHLKTETRTNAPSGV